MYVKAVPSTAFLYKACKACIWDLAEEICAISAAMFLAKIALAYP